jgi:hypothetical protein
LIIKSLHRFKLLLKGPELHLILLRLLPQLFDISSRGFEILLIPVSDVAYLHIDRFEHSLGLISTLKHRIDKDFSPADGPKSGIDTLFNLLDLPDRRLIVVFAVNAYDDIQYHQNQDEGQQKLQ